MTPHLCTVCARRLPGVNPDSQRFPQIRCHSSKAVAPRFAVNFYHPNDPWALEGAFLVGAERVFGDKLLGHERKLVQILCKMNPEQLQSLAVLALAMVPVALLWWVWIQMLD